MGDRDSSRREVARQVMKHQRRADFRSVLAVAADGSRPIVVALPDDTVASMFVLVAAAGGTATVAVPVAGAEHGTLDLIPVAPDHMTEDLGEDGCPVHPDTHVDMLVTYLRRQKRPVRCQLVAPEYGFGPSKAYADA